MMMRMISRRCTLIWKNQHWPRKAVAASKRKENDSSCTGTGFLLSTICCFQWMICAMKRLLHLNTHIEYYGSTESNCYIEY